MPTVPEFTALDAAHSVYGQYGIQVDEQGGMSVALSPDDQITLSDISTECNFDQESFEQDHLFAQGGGRQGIGSIDIVVWYVNSITQPDGNGLDGCKGHKPGSPAVRVAATATPFAMGHEVGHVLLGSSFVPVHTKSKANLMFEGFLGDLTANPLGLTRSQVKAMRASPLVSRT